MSACAGERRSIRLDFEADDPPEGLAIGDGDRVVPFAGWLSLLQALGDLVAGRLPEGDAGVRSRTCSRRSGRSG